MSEFTIFHNPRCSKSRQTLEILQDKGVDVEVFEYLKTPMDKQQLADLFKALNKKPKEVLRTKEEDYKALNIDLDNDGEVIKAIIDYPKILERPIVKKEELAIIGRPPEKVLELF